jgi:hypothetical protein
MIPRGTDQRNSAAPAGFAAADILMNGRKRLRYS